MTYPSEVREFEPESGVRSSRGGRRRGFLWWIGLIYTFLLVLLFLITSSLLVMVYLTLYGGKTDSIDMEAINRRNENVDVDTLTPRSALRQSAPNNYVFVPEDPRERASRAAIDSLEDEMDPYLPSTEAEANADEDAPSRDDRDLGSLGGGGGDAPMDPNGNFNPLDALF